MWTPTPTTVLTKAHLKLRVRGCHDEAVILCIQGALWHILETKMSEVSSYGAGIKLSEMYSAHERRMTENICLCFSSFIIWSSISLLSWLLLPAPFFFLYRTPGPAHQSFQLWALTALSPSSSSSSFLSPQVIPFILLPFHCQQPPSK